ERVGRQWRRQHAVADQIGIAAHRAGEIARTLAVYRVGVPDAADVDALARRTNQFAFTLSAPRAHHDVGRGRAGIGVEAARRARAQAISAVGGEVAAAAAERSELGGAMLGGGEPMTVVEIRQEPD